MLQANPSPLRDATPASRGALSAVYASKLAALVDFTAIDTSTGLWFDGTVLKLHAAAPGQPGAVIDGPQTFPSGLKAFPELAATTFGADAATIGGVTLLDSSGIVTNAISASSGSVDDLVLTTSLTVGGGTTYVDAAGNLLLAGLAQVGSLDVDNDASVGGDLYVGGVKYQPRIIDSVTSANGLSLSGGVLSMAAASGATAGAMTGGTQSFAGAKTFTGAVSVSGLLTASAAITAGANVLSLRSGAGAGASDVAAEVGSTVADASVHATAKLLRVATGLGGTVNEKFSVAKGGATFGVGVSGTTLTLSGLLTAPSAVSAASNTLTLRSDLGAGSSDVAVLLGTTVANGSVDGNATLLRVATGIGGVVTEKLRVTVGAALLSTRLLITDSVAGSASLVVAQNNASPSGDILSLSTGSGASVATLQAALLALRVGTPLVGLAGGINTSTDLRIGSRVKVARLSGFAAATLTGPEAADANGTLTLDSGLGAGSSDVALLLGSAVADGSVHATAKLLRVATGVGGTVTEKLSVTKSDVTLSVPLVLGGVTSTSWPKGATVATSETQAASAAYGDLTTVGPTVSITTGTSAIVLLGMSAYRSGAGNTAFISVAVSGASSVAASDANAAFYSSAGAGQGPSVMRSLFLSGLTPGTNVFTAKYRNDGGSTWTFMNRSIVVIPSV